MPAVAELLATRAGVALELLEDTATLVKREMFELEKRIKIPYNSSSPPGLIEAETVDPWSKSGKYALGWVYFCVILLVLAIAIRLYHLWTDKIRTALHKDELLDSANTPSPDVDYELSALATDKSTVKFFPRDGALPTPPPTQSRVSSNWLVNSTIALFRYLFYRPVPSINYRKGYRPFVFTAPGTLAIVAAALIFTLLYCFVPQPLYWQSIAFGSPPLAIRAGMIAVAMMPWIVALSMKANFISLLTGIGHERLNVLHRWLAYLCLVLSLVHMIPFYVTPVWEDGGWPIFRILVTNNGKLMTYGTGIAAFVPLAFLCAHGIPPLRRHFYEAFVVIHVPVSIIFLGMLFWHCANYLTSWAYLYSTVGIWLASYAMRLFYLNWTNPFRMSWLIGEEAAVTVLQEDAVKVTIPTQMKWRPGQYVYLRMPGVSIFENHPFTIASLCSDDFPSGYGEEYRDMILVFRPYGGFTKRVLDNALDHGPWHTYRAFLDGPYGGMRRSLDSFDHVVLIAGGSGITALVSQLLDLVKRMRDGKAVTKTVHVIWALKRPDIMEWFKEELRICREYAPPDAVRCQFYITAAKRQSGRLVSAHTPNRPVSMVLHDKVNDVFQNIASNRYSTTSSKRYSALIREEAAGDQDVEKALRAEIEDHVRPLPEAHLKPPPPTMSSRHLSPSPERRGRMSNERSSHSRSPDGRATTAEVVETPHLPPHPTLHEKRRSRNLSLDLAAAQNMQTNTLQEYTQTGQQADFGFPSTPTEFQKNLMRFAFMPAAARAKTSGWSTEWGRPDIPYALKEMSEEWTGRRSCVFVCGPPSMRIDVSNTVAELQKQVWGPQDRDEIFLHAENYAL